MLPHLVTHDWVGRAVRLPAVRMVQRARPRDVVQGERSTGVVSHNPHTTPIVTGPQQEVLHMLQSDPHTSWRQTLATRSRICASHAERAATTRARCSIPGRRAAPMAADAPLLQCVRLSTGARRYLEHSMSLARAATRSRRSDHLQHPSRLELHRPPSRRYTCADRQATRSCGRH